ncbi:MAG: AAA family ATPase, partial [Bacteroidales bacterium]|nr:AAA family ATPase [Bacteroidales bacterium]
METPIRKYPIGTQDFETLITGGFAYVDKTEFVYALTTNHRQVFLSRPRRFGKSLFLTTLKAYFEGKKELFNGLKISELEKDWTEYPVFHIEFNRSGFSSLESLKSVLRENLAIIEKVWGETDKNEELSVRFSTLIRKAAKKSGKKVVVLVDEYDKPLFSTMHDDVLNDQMRTELKGFYGVLKAEDEHLRFVFLTGVTKFSQVSVFSDLNHLDDISLFKEYAQICGISEAEFFANFQPDIEKLATENEMNIEETVNKLRHYYDGYHFAKQSEGMYNPYSLLNTLQKHDFG